MRPSRVWAGLLVVLACGATLEGCGRQEQQLVPVRPSVDERLQLSVAGRDVRVELAVDTPTRNRGLMHRTRMDEDAGMLFVFPDSAPRTFWMRNTLLPLDIIFLDEQGRVINVVEAPPMVERPGFHSTRAARYVLELNQGWCKRHGLAAGDRIAIPADVTARGV